MIIRTHLKSEFGLQRWRARKAAQQRLMGKAFKQGSRSRRDSGGREAAPMARRETQLRDRGGRVRSDTAQTVFGAQ